MTRETNIETALRFLAIVTVDLEAALRHMSADATWWIAGSTSISGLWRRDQLHLLGSKLRVADLKVLPLPNGIIADGNKVAVEAESFGRHESTGKPYNNHYHYVFEFVDGKIHRLKEYMDTQHLASLIEYDADTEVP